MKVTRVAFLIIFLLVVGTALATSPPGRAWRVEGIGLGQRQVAWIKEGEYYRYIGSYPTPAGEQKNVFQLTLDDEGRIKDVTVYLISKSAAASEYQGGFAEAVGDRVVGKLVTNVGELDRVSGASLTTRAFNKAILKLKEQLN
ncbi:hypothetical protein A3A66_02305 [Microgenomates group bacterium RIFCSPLOWO2_01_FULL_46_13]|nr:MAG: hypothetical protein A2783_00605 [Microgenomates group bacterium RIFCSPHIGHO2_01_FULL_45_11]OGV94806.1 MAG: hypothetical protein A3A66_02305 [Microgenomates group bacterium RIFCSPLOWO2_01_FULL_46_13]